MFENFITDHSEEDKNELAAIRDILPKKDQQSFNNDNKLKLTLTSFFAIDFGVSKTERKKDGGNFKLNTESSFENKRASHRWAKTYSAHSLHVYTFMESHCKVLLSLWANKKFLFDTCQMTVKMHNLHLFPVPQNRKLHNKQLISLILALYCKY